MATIRTVTVENTTEHPFDFAHFEHGGLAVRVPAARLETPNGTQTAGKKNGSMQVPELLLARCLREPVVRFWFSSRDLLLPTTTVEQLMAIEIPSETKPATAASTAADQEELRTLRARNAELEAAAKTQPKKDAAAK